MLTGYSPAHFAEELHTDRRTTVLTKPFTRMQIDQGIRAILDHQPGRRSSVAAELVPRVNDDPHQGTPAKVRNVGSAQKPIQ
jgi:hypothetical protein